MSQANQITKSPKELSLEERIIETLNPEKLNGETLPLEIVKILFNDHEIAAMQNYANIVSIKRLGFNDHGPVHMRTVTRNVIRMMKLLHKSGIKTSLEDEEVGTFADSLTAVIIASFLHDLGMTIGRQDHEIYSVHFALPIIDRILLQALPETTDQSTIRRRVIIRSLAVEGIAGHMGTHKIHSLEAGMILVADGCDMTKGRARIPIALNSSARAGDIHKYSANSIEKVLICGADDNSCNTSINLVPEEQDFTKRKPIHIEITMSSEVGFFQIEEVLIPKINSSPVKPYIELFAGLENCEKKQYL